MKYTVIGFFTCGCEHEASLLFDVVECETLEEVTKVKELMKQHSASFQCSLQGVQDIMVFPATVMDNRKIISFKGYVSIWGKRDKQGKEMQKKLKKMEKF